MDKRQLTTALAKYFVNPMTTRVAGFVPWWALLETTGRKTGLPRRNPVANGLDGDTFWIIAEHGRKANYVRNIQANPRVRVRVGRRWRSGTAQLVPGDDPRARQRQLSQWFNSAVLSVVGTDLLTIRIDLDQTPRAGATLGPRTEHITGVSAMTGKERLEAYLRENGVPFEMHHHPEAFTAQEVAAAEHIPGRILGKVVAVKAGGDIAMAVIPAPAHVDLDKAAAAVGSGDVSIASEDEFGPIFSDCDTGAMPPFGNGTLYDVPVFVDTTLAQQETVAFDAGTHRDTVHLRYADFERLVKPNAVDLTD